PCVERGGIIWAYMGPRKTPPPLPDLEANMLANASVEIRANMQMSNWVQVMEGSLDDSHAGFLHSGCERPEDRQPGTFQYYDIKDRSPRSFVVDTEGGVTFGSRRDAKPGYYYWRILHYMFPFTTMAPIAVLGLEKRFVCRVPMDDEHTMQYFVTAVNDD